LGAGFYGLGVPGWKGKFFRAVRKVTRLRVSKLLELIPGMQRINVRSVDKSFKSLHTTGMFVLDSVDTLFLWFGSNTGKKQNLKAQEFAKKCVPRLRLPCLLALTDASPSRAGTARCRSSTSRARPSSARRTSRRIPSAAAASAAAQLASKADGFSSRAHTGFCPAGRQRVYGILVLHRRLR
jgi:hypothetical protein